MPLCFEEETPLPGSNSPKSTSSSADCRPGGTGTASVEESTKNLGTSRSSSERSKGVTAGFGGGVFAFALDFCLAGVACGLRSSASRSISSVRMMSRSTRPGLGSSLMSLSDAERGGDSG